MSTNPVKEIYKFNKEAGLLARGYEDYRESSFPIEEALEGFSGLAILGEQLGMRPEIGDEMTAKDISRVILDYANVDDVLSDVDRFDKHLDTIVFAFGSIFKLGLTPQQALKGLSVVMAANMQKLTAGKDEHGKQMKPEGFIPPEEELQKILDERNTNGDS